LLCDEKENTHSTNHQIQKNLTFLDGDQTHLENKNEKRLLSQQPEELDCFVAVDDKTDCSTVQLGLRQDPTPREELTKRCQWFHGFNQPVSTNAAPSPSQRNHSKLSPKQVYRRMESRRQVSPTAICSLKAEECESEFPPPHSQAASRKATQFQVGVCLAPGSIPSNMIVQLTREESESGKETKAIMEIDGERDLWLEDICNQALTKENADEPGTMTAPVEAGVTIVHDLQDEICPAENGNLDGFLQSRKASQRRRAICEELEMVMGLVKINGAKFSLWHLRKELLQTIK